MPEERDLLRGVAKQVTKDDEKLREASFEAELARIFRGETPPSYSFIEGMEARPKPEPPAKPELSWWEKIERYMPWRVVGIDVWRGTKAGSLREEYQKKYPELKPYQIEELPEFQAEYAKIRQAPVGEPAPLPTPEEVREFGEMPWYQQLLYEAPFWGMTAAAPSAIQIRGALSAKYPITATRPLWAKTVLQSIRPGVKIEEVQAKIIQAVAGKISATRINLAFHRSAEWQHLMKQGIKPTPALEQRLRTAFLYELQGHPQTAANIRTEIYQSFPQWRPDFHTPVPEDMALMLWAGGGEALLPMNPQKWALLNMSQRVNLVQSLGLSGKIASKAWGALTGAEKTVLMGEVPTVPEAVPEVVAPTQEIRISVRDYWDKNLEDNPLRAHYDKSSAGAILSYHIEAAGDVIRALGKEKAHYIDPAYIDEKLLRIQRGVQSPRDWSGELTSEEIDKVAEAQKLLEDLPTPTTESKIIKDMITAITKRQEYTVGDRLNELIVLLKSEGIGIEIEPITRPKVAPPAVEVIPKPEIGMPEPGLQAGALGVPSKIVTPPGKGEITQISMDEQMKLEEAKWAEERALVSEMEEELAGLKETLANDPVALFRLTMGGKNVDLTHFISLREQEFPNYFTVKQAEALYPYHKFIKYTQKGLSTFNKVPRDEALDKLTKELDLSPDEIANRVMAIRAERARIKELKAAIASIEVKAAPIVPGITPPTKKPPVKAEVPPKIAPPEIAMATNEQKAQIGILAKDKALIDPKTGKPRDQYKRLAEAHTGQRDIDKMTPEEADRFIEALTRYPEKKWSAKAGGWIPQAMPKTKAIVPENYFNLEFGEPTPVRLFTSQNFYAVKLGVAPLTQPLELAKQELDLVFPAWSRAVDGKLKELDKVYRVTLREKLAARVKNKPTRASAEMAKLLNQYEDLPPALVAELGMEKVKLFAWFRNLNRTILNAQNQIREVLDMPPIPHRQAYFRHLADETMREVWQGSLSFPQDLAYWSSRIVGKKIFNPMEIPRQMADDLLEYFSKDIGYVTKAMLWTGLKEIYLSQPLRAFTAQLNVLNKGMMPFSSLSPEEMARAKAVAVLPASTRKWTEDYIRIVIKGQQTEFDASVNRLVTQSGLGGIFNTLLKPFGRSIGTRPVTRMAQFSGRLIISATIGTKPRQIIRNLWQSTQNLALYGVKATLKAFLPADKTLTRILDQSMFLKTYARYEELPTSAMGKVERAWLWAYGKSAFFNARTGMKAAYHGTKKYVFDPKYKDYGWADPARTYTEPKGFLYPSEFEALKMEAEFGSGCTQYQYIAMGMPEVFRHKVLIPLTRLQSWWMNYFFKFNREAISRFWNGYVGWDKTKKIDWVARLNWLKYVILGGAVLTAMGYKRSFMKGVLPVVSGYYWGSPAGQFMTSAYGYVIADSDWEREKAKRTMFSSLRAFMPGMIDYKSFEAVWSGDKPLSSLFFYGEDWPPDMPTWGIPPLEEKADIENAIKYSATDLAETRKKLGKFIPAEDGAEGYTYEMVDLGADIRATTRDIPLGQITKENGFSDIIIMYKQAELYWDSYYYSLPASDRAAFRDNPQDISAWTEAYLFIWGKLSVLRNDRSLAVVEKLMKDYHIPDKAVPALGTQRGRGLPIAPSTFEEELRDIFKGEQPPTKPTAPSEQESFEEELGKIFRGE